MDVNNDNALITVRLLFAPAMPLNHDQMYIFVSHLVSWRIVPILESFALRYCPFRWNGQFFRFTWQQAMAPIQLVSPLLRYCCSVFCSFWTSGRLYGKYVPYTCTKSRRSTEKYCPTVCVASFATSSIAESGISEVTISSQTRTFTSERTPRAPMTGTVCSRNEFCVNVSPWMWWNKSRATPNLVRSSFPE